MLQVAIQLYNGAYGWRYTILVMPNVKKIRGLNLPGTPWATSAGCWMIFIFTLTTMTTNLQAKRHTFLSLNPATSRSHSVSAPALSLFNEANFKILRPTECFSRYECNGESPSADWICQKINWQHWYWHLGLATADNGCVVLGHEDYAGQRTHIYGIIQPYWKLVWGGDAQHNRLEERRKFSNMVWMLYGLRKSLHFCQNSQLEISWKWSNTKVLA